MKLKTVFLIDGLGAVLTAVLLATVLPIFNEYFGMPREILTLLSIVAVVLAGYSLSCFLFSRNASPKLLKPLVVANLAYCILTFGLVIYFFERLTSLGIIYFLGEVLIILGIVRLEWKVKQAFKNPI